VQACFSAWQCVLVTYHGQEHLGDALLPHELGHIVAPGRRRRAWQLWLIEPQFCGLAQVQVHPPPHERQVEL
jgi:hypothetical protein